jgi:hypothetical protein
MFRHELQTAVEIDAPTERVWSLLLDFASYPAWNPFIREISGVPEVGARLVVRLGPPGKKASTFRPVVRRVVAAREFVWLGHLLVSGLFDGEHRFRLEPLDGGRRTRFCHSERFGGLLVPLLRRSLDTDFRSAFVAMNEALKARAETGPAAP